MFLRYEYTVYIEDIQFFIMNMPFISSSEAKNAYFMSGFTYTFTRWNKWHNHDKKSIFFLIYTIVSVRDFLH